MGVGRQADLRNNRRGSEIVKMPIAIVGCVLAGAAWSQSKSIEPPVPATWQGFQESRYAPDRTLVTSIRKMELYAACIAWGRAARAGNDDRRKFAFLAYIQSENGINGTDVGSVRERHPVIGMSLCGVAAVMGRPDAVNQTQTATRHRSQLVYRAKRTYVYMEGETANGLVTAVQF